MMKTNGKPSLRVQDSRISWRTPGMRTLAFAQVLTDVGPNLKDRWYGCRTTR
jgi:hypothetical protein